MAQSVAKMEVLPHLQFSASNNSYIGSVKALPMDIGVEPTLRLGLISFTIAIIALLAYVSYVPSVDPRAPPFTKDKTPLAGSFGYLFRSWDFWKSSAQRSKTGNFSFWVGKQHVVAVTGSSARRMVVDNDILDFPATQHIRPFGAHFYVPDIFQPGFNKGQSYFLRRLYDAQKTDQLEQHVPGLVRDVRLGLQALASRPNKVTNPSMATLPIVYKQDARVMMTGDISESPEFLSRYMRHGEMIQNAASNYTTFFPWLIEPGYVKRKLGRYRLEKLVRDVIDARLQKGNASSSKDFLQFCINNGDPKEFMVEYFTSILFIATANSRLLTGHLLSIMAIYPEWQDKVYAEVKAVLGQWSKNKTASVLDQLDALPLEAWESGFPTIELCFQEITRFWVGIPMTRKNNTPYALPIPGTNEVVPPGSYVGWHTAEVHYDETLYPNPLKYDPERHLKGRQEFKKEENGFVAWGAGKHPCPGKRWAKVQENIIVAHAVAFMKWTVCDKDGNAIAAEHKKELNTPNPTLFRDINCKYELREEL